MRSTRAAALCLFACLLFSASCFAQKKKAARPLRDNLPSKITPKCNPESTEAPIFVDLKELQLRQSFTLDELLKTSGGSLSVTNTKGKSEPFAADEGTAYIFHVVSWTDVPTIEKSEWYAYRYRKAKNDFTAQYTPPINGTQPLLYGTPSAYLISIQVFPDDQTASIAEATPTQPPSPRASLTYSVNVTKQTPANLADAALVLSTILGVKPSLVKSLGRPVCMSGAPIRGTGLPYDITITASPPPKQSDPKNPPGDSGVKMTQTFHALDKEWWDLGIGMVAIPLKETLVSSGKQSTVNRINPYGFFDVFPLAAFYPKNDFRSPHLQIGVPLSGQPLHRPYAGVGEPIPWLEQHLGFAVNVFGGIDFMRVQYSATGNPHWVKKRVFGVELPVGKLIGKVTGVKSK